MDEIILKMRVSAGIRLEWGDYRTIAVPEDSPAYLRFLATGGGSGPIDALRKSLYLSEFDTEPDRVNARENLGLQIIDLGTFS